MRKTTIVTLVVLAAAGVAAFFVLGGPLNPDGRLVNGLSNDFMEDLQFKDFRRGASYHHKLERDRVDIGKTMEKLFLIKHESLDIQSFRIVKSEIDSTGGRARVHFRTRFHRLNFEDEPEDGELIVYWMRRNPDCPIGAQCTASGECFNEYDERLHFWEKTDKPIKESELAEYTEKAEKAHTSPPSVLTCDPKAEDRWFMNLDSTLEEKRYNY